MILTLLAFLLLGSGQASPSTPPTVFQQLSAQADEARNADHLPQAIRLYRQALQLRPNWSEGWWALASICYEQDRFSEAQAAIERYIALGKNAAPAYAFLGLCEYETRDYDHARQHFGYWVRKGLPGGPALASVASFRRAELLTLEGRFLESVYLLSTMVNPKAPDSALVEPMGLAWMRMKNVPEDYPPERREMVWLAGSAALSMAAKKFDLADEYLQQLAVYYDKAPNVHFLRGFAFEAEGKAAEAKEEYRHELELSPGHALAMAKVAVLELQDGQLDQARRIAGKAVTLEPENGQAHYALGRVFLVDEKLAEAARELETARKLVPNAAEVHRCLADVYRRLGRGREAARETSAFLALQAEEAAISPAAGKRDSVVEEKGRTR